MSRSVSTALAVLLIATGAPGVSAQTAWQVRRAHLPDQTDEWTALGRIPAWQVTVGEGEAGEVRIAGDEAGDFRGIVLVGRPWTVPDPLPAELRVAFEYQTFCASDDPPYERTGALYLGLFTPEQWAALAEEPAAAEVLNTARPGDAAIAIVMAHANSGPDVLQWRAWESPNLRSLLREHAGAEIILAVVWSANHSVEEWGAFRGVGVRTVSEADRERAFLEAIDPDHPGLGAFRAAMQAGDLEAAKTAFVAHMRTRTSPPGPTLSAGSGTIIARADEILEHTFRLASCPPTQLELPIRWNEDPHNYDQWPIALNRHSEWVTLAQAYLATGDERYAAEFVALLNSWVDAMPVNIGPSYVEGPFFEPGRSPLTLDAGIRMAQSWWLAFYAFRASPSFDDASLLRMVRSFHDHALYLMEPQYFHVQNNWGAMEANGLFHLAAMLPEMRESRLWLDTARERLVALQNAQVYPDGAQMELTPGYAWVTLANLLGSIEVAERTGVELPAELVAGLESMFAYYAAIAMPDGSVPNVNDSGRSRVADILRRGLELFPARADFEYVMTGGRSGEAPAYTSHRLPYAGWNIMRTGWAPQDRYLFFETGPFGAAHQHEDKLGIIAHCAGRTVLPEAGVYSYDRSEWRRYVLSTRAHNTVMVDGLEQNRRGRPETRVVMEPEDARWFTDEQFDFARGVYADGYGPDNAVAVTHERSVLFVKPDYWLVCDLMTPADDAEHEYEAIFHLDGEDPQIDPATGAVTVIFEGAAFRVLPVGTVAPGVAIVQGQTEPEEQGWMPTGRHSELRPIPTALFRWRATGPSAMAFLLLPREAGGEFPVTGARAIEATGDALAVAADLDGGGRDVFVRAWGGGAEVAGICRTDAEAALVRIVPEGQAGAVFSSGGGAVEMLRPGG